MTDHAHEDFTTSIKLFFTNIVLVTLWISLLFGSVLSLIWTTRSIYFPFSSLPSTSHATNSSLLFVSSKYWIIVNSPEYATFLAMESPKAGILSLKNSSNLRSDWEKLLADFQLSVCWSLIEEAKAKRRRMKQNLSIMNMRSIEKEYN